MEKSLKACRQGTTSYKNVVKFIKFQNRHRYVIRKGKFWERIQVRLNGRSPTFPPPRLKRSPSSCYTVYRPVLSRWYGIKLEWVMWYVNHNSILLFSVQYVSTLVINHNQALKKVSEERRVTYTTLLSNRLRYEPRNASVFLLAKSRNCLS